MLTSGSDLTYDALTKTTRVIQLITGHELKVLLNSTHLMHNPNQEPLWILYYSQFF